MNSMSMSLVHHMHDSPDNYKSKKW